MRPEGEAAGLLRDARNDGTLLNPHWHPPPIRRNSQLERLRLSELIMPETVNENFVRSSQQVKLHPQFKVQSETFILCRATEAMIVVCCCVAKTT